jgi:hypothetical protein
MHKESMYSKANFGGPMNANHQYRENMDINQAIKNE